MLSSYAKQQILRTRTQAMFPYLIEVTHKDFGTLRYANSDFDIEYDGQTYKASSFSIDPPDKDGGRIGNASITISAIDQFWIEKIRNTNKYAHIRFIAAIKYDNAGNAVVEPIEDYEFTLKNASWNEISIQWEMVFDDVMNIVVPCDRATAQKVPALG